MNKICSGVRYFLVLILLGLGAGCSASIGNDAADLGQSVQSKPPIITVYKAPT